MSASLPMTPPPEVNGNFLSATIDVTSPYDDNGKFDDVEITPLATIVEENNDNDKGYGTKYSSVAAAAATAKHGDDDEEEDDDVSNKDADYLDEDYVPDDDADDHDKDSGEEDIISQVQKRSAATLYPSPQASGRGTTMTTTRRTSTLTMTTGVGSAPPFLVFHRDYTIPTMRMTNSSMIISTRIMPISIIPLSPTTSLVIRGAIVC